MADTRKKSHSTEMFSVKGTWDSSYLRPLITQSTFLRKEWRKKTGPVTCLNKYIKYIYLIFNKI